MNSEKRYSVWIRIDTASKTGPEFYTWADAKESCMSWNSRDPDSRHRIFDHSTVPPTDVTDADPDAEKRWWYCRWDNSGLFTCTATWSAQVDAFATWEDGDLLNAAVNIHSATEPTFESFAAAVKDVAGVEIPQPEEPTWWCWNEGKGQWFSDHEPDPPFVPVFVNILGQRVLIIHGTTETRDAKRDRLLAAILEAGRP